MRTREALRGIGRDLNRIYINNVNSKDYHEKCKVGADLSGQDAFNILKHFEGTLRTDIHELLEANRQLVAILHSTVPDKTITKRDIDRANDAMVPPEAGEAKQQLISHTPPEEEKPWVDTLPWSLRKRMTNEGTEPDPENN